LHERSRKIADSKKKCLEAVFMKIEIWLITFCKSEDKDI